jgi:hypothetical protein
MAYIDCDWWAEAGAGKPVLESAQKLWETALPHRKHSRDLSVFEWIIGTRLEKQPSAYQV